MLASITSSSCGSRDTKPSKGFRMRFGRTWASSVSALAVGSLMAAEDGVWRERAALPHPVAGYMAGVIDGRLVIAGGSYWEDGEKRWTTRVQRFDPVANRWEEGQPMPEPRSDAACAVVEGDLYVFGGGANGVARSDALVYSGNSWRPVPSARLPEPRLYAVAVSLHDDIYVLGGLVKAGDYAHMSNAFWRWTPDADRGWEELPPLPGPGRISHAMTVIQQRIYVLGGATAGGGSVANLSDAYVFDPATRRWSELPALPIARRAWSAVTVGERALLVGGYTDDFVADVHAYVPGQGLVPAAALPHRIADAKFLPLGDRIIGAGGEAGPRLRGEWTLEAPVSELLP